MTDKHQINGNDLDVSCECGWYNHDPDPATDKSATAHVLREVTDDSRQADDYETDYRDRYIGEARQASPHPHPYWEVPGLMARLMSHVRWSTGDRVVTSRWGPGEVISVMGGPRGPQLVGVRLDKDGRVLASMAGELRFER